MGVMSQRRNSSGQFKRCVKAVSRRKSVRDASAVCAASERRRGLINPASYRGKSVADLEQMRVFAEVRAYDIDWLVRDRGRRDVVAIDKALKNARKREAKHGNPLPLVAAEALETQALTPYQKKATAAAKGFQKKIGLKLNRRKNPRNPANQAASVYEGLHGRPSSEVIEIITQIHEHQHVASYGELVALYIIPERGRGAVKLSGFETRKGFPAFLTTNEDRTQLFIDGGDQAVKLSVFGIREPIHETEVLGELAAVDYYTTKDHLGSQGGEAVYHHTFSKRRRPVVIYDTVNSLLYLAGGRYENLDEGITN
jgi:hypothetical protein